MLGHVFENLLVKAERGQSGTFYTPQIIVSYMCRQSLLEYLATHLLHDSEQQTIAQEKLTREALENFIAYAELTTEYEGQNVKSYDDRKFPPSLRVHAQAIDQKLCVIKVCDPAIGSGAFPVGILQEIVRLRSALMPLLKEEIENNNNEKQKKAALQQLGKSHTPYALKHNAIENSIYGVDKEQSAVDIARLRLWLSLIVDEDDLSPDKSLPNLDYKIMQGNSLLNEFQGLELIPSDFVVKHSAKNLLPNEDRKAQLLKLQADYFTEIGRSGKDSIEAHRIFRQIETLNKQIAADKKTDTSAQGDLLQVAATGKEQIKKLHRIHQQIFQSRDKHEKDELRRQSDLIVLEFMNDHLTEGTTQLQQELTRTRTKLTEEIANVRQKMKADIQTPKIKSLTRTLESLESSLQQREASQLALKNLWETTPTQATLDLTEIDEANFTTSKPKDFTLWELQFVEMFFDAEGEARTNGGFDVLIANPPYIRQEKIKEYKAAFERRFSTYTGTADILVYFYEQAINLLRQGGTLTFITSNKYFRAGYGEGLRALLGNNTQIKQIIDFGDAPVFEAAAYASIIVLNKEAMKDNETRVWTFPQKESVDDFEAAFRRFGFRLPQHELRADGWRLENQIVLRLLENIRSQGKLLSNYLAEEKIYLGIKTGLNDAFVIPSARRDQLIEKDKSSKEVLKPFLRGRDVKRWSAEYSEQYLIKIESSGNKKHPWSGKSLEGAEKIFAETYPAIHEHFQAYREDLIKREDQGVYFWELRACKYWKEFERPKILYPDIYSHQSFAWDADGFISGNTTYLIPTKEKWLTAILNSNLIEWFYSQLSNKLRGGYLRAFTDYMKQVPIPSAQDWQKEIIETLVEYILFLTKTDSEKLIVNYFESILNGLVYELFLPDELHAAGKEFFAPLRAEALPTLEEISGDKLSELQNIRARLSQPNHHLQQNLSTLDRLESVRIIAGKA